MDHPGGREPSSYPPAPGLPTPPPGYPPHPAWPAPPGQPMVVRPPGTNGFAITSLVLGLLGAVLFSVGFGIAALSQVRRTGQAGRGMAVAGLCLSGAWVLALVGAVAFAVLSSATRGDDGAVVSSGQVSARDLHVGDCFEEITERSTIYSLPAVPCSEPHQAEVFATFDLEPGPFPGDDRLDTLATRGCTERFETSALGSTTSDEFDLYYLYPLRQNWREGDREIVCIALSLPGPESAPV
ncbi:DUF4190 domain-containing protein [Phycicoccus sp. CSK15P-2]|uniref:DUF4190 domain-containing protein n=1 Tax=Phycicoccus sp. CSK15P-2 TaxID=2807627 RepID=UPI0019508D56|nr:DUF4190 domain-containing protein [Phycicoccus sp. CSK15P-2]MBM6403176.1 DUF4190 domain-containing protein [Phycicoccus sp. CSK15P-2]